MTPLDTISCFKYKQVGVQPHQLTRQLNNACVCCWVLCCSAIVAGCRHPLLSIDMFCPQGAQQHTQHMPQWLSDNGTDSRTPDHYIDPAVHTMRAVSTREFNVTPVCMHAYTKRWTMTRFASHSTIQCYQSLTLTLQNSRTFLRLSRRRWNPEIYQRQNIGQERSVHTKDKGKQAVCIQSIRKMDEQTGQKLQNYVSKSWAKRLRKDKKWSSGI